jgi:hypothetical protein
VAALREPGEALTRLALSIAAANFTRSNEALGTEREA